jgi:O-antigen ligase
MAMEAGRRPTAPGSSDWLTRIVSAVLVIAVGVILGLQYINPDKRALAVLAAAAIFGIAWRLDTVTGLGLMILAIPYPRGTVFGSTNFAFILLLALIWLLRVSQRMSPPPVRTPVDMPIAGLAIAYVISFYNIANSAALGYAIQNTEQFLVCLLLFYMLTSNIRTVEHLKRLQTFQAISIATILLLALFELNHPGGAFIPGWIEFHGTVGTEFNTKNVRVGGPFFDYEMLSEFCAVNSLLILFLIMRATTVARRVALSALLLFDVFVMFTTVTRGAFVSLAFGLTYLVFRMRRRVRVVPLALAAVAIVATVLFLNFFVSNFTRSGNIMARFQETKFVGLVPDDRVQVWKDGWNLFLEHPWIGHGPYYAMQIGAHFASWPHNGYLLLGYFVGLVGVVFFFVLLFHLLRLSNACSDDMYDPNYARAFLLFAHVQIVVFMVDQTKIDFLRNPTYMFEVWVMFAMLVAASRLARIEASTVPFRRRLLEAA